MTEYEKPGEQEQVATTSRREVLRWGIAGVGVFFLGGYVVKGFSDAPRGIYGTPLESTLPPATATEVSPTTSSAEVAAMEILTRDPTRLELYADGAKLNGYTFTPLATEFVDSETGAVCMHVVRLSVNEYSVSEQLEALRLDWQAYPEELPAERYDSVPFNTHMSMLESINRTAGYDGDFDDVWWRTDELWFPICTTP